MELGKMSKKFLNSFETLIFYEFLKIENSALFPEHDRAVESLKVVWV